MNATQKQINYIKSLADKAGKNIDQEQMQGLSKEEASRTIDSLQQQVEPETGQDNATPVPPVVNNALFGLAAKLVWHYYLAINKPPRNDQYPGDVIRTYKRLTRARRRLKQHLEDDTQ